MSINRIDVGPRMSGAVVHNNTVYLSGQVGNAGDSVADQTKTILGKIDALLEKAGTSKKNAIKGEIWLSDMAYFEEMNGVWDAWVVEGNTPARCCGESKLAAPGFYVEIMITASV
ncbi:MAG: RidA family protein [Cohaesibacteraceae bacterium]|nr:RidA family protein [Cohaesibacteraceae bacterium]